MSNKTAAQEFQRLLDICDTLLGDGGCPWDREQTLVSMREAMLEEACEVIEAIDEENDTDLIEELGDLLYIVLFFCKLAEKEKRFETIRPLVHICDKLIFRHPHVFSGEKVESAEEVLIQWEKIKKQEKSHRESLLDGIPKGLAALARSYKIAGKMKKRIDAINEEDIGFSDEEQLGDLLWKITLQARKKRINPENALRKEMMKQESAFRLAEQANKQ